MLDNQFRKLIISMPKKYSVSHQFVCMSEIEMANTFLVSINAYINFFMLNVKLLPSYLEKMRTTNVYRIILNVQVYKII